MQIISAFPITSTFKHVLVSGLYFRIQFLFSIVPSKKNRRYKISPMVIRDLTTVIKQRKTLNRFGTIRGTKYAIGDLILMAIKWLRNTDIGSLMELFGGQEKTIEKGLKIAFETLDAFGYVFKNGCPTLDEESEIKRHFRINGTPCPDAVYVGDCTDIPIWCKDKYYYTYKRCCPSTKAIRVLVILRRDTMQPVFVRSGAAPSGPEASDTNMLLGSKFDNYARAGGM